MSDAKKWNFFTNHSHVLFYLAFHPDLPMRDVAQAVGITERAVQRIVADLAESGVLERERVGRQNVYKVRRDYPLRHHLEAHRNIGDLLAFIKKGED
jgi:DNA-binding Lrp family transcriptional regulator